HRRGDIRPIQAESMAHFVSCILHPTGDRNIGQDFVWLQSDFAFVLRSRSAEEIGRLDLPRFAVRSFGGERRAQCNQYWPETGGADEQRGAVSRKNGVVAIVSFADERSLAVFAEQPEAISIIPAA